MTVTVANDEAGPLERLHFQRLRGGADVSALVILMIMATPAIYLVYVSFRHETCSDPGRCSQSLQNYSRVVSNRENWSAALSTIQFVVLAVSLELGFGLGLALLLNRRLPESDLLTALFILPLGVAPVVSALVFRVLLDPAYGWVDYYLQTWGLDRRAIDWLGNPFTAWVAIVSLDFGSGRRSSH
jgi:multiple sugar transport system permease protein